MKIHKITAATLLAAVTRIEVTQGIEGGEEEFRQIKTFDACNQPPLIDTFEDCWTRAAIQNFAYNWKTNTCDKFVTGGCNIREGQHADLRTNLFSNEEDCEESCLRSAIDFKKNKLAMYFKEFLSQGEPNNIEGQDASEDDDMPNVILKTAGLGSGGGGRRRPLWGSSLGGTEPSEDDNLPVCEQTPRKNGFCRGWFESWTFDPETNECIKFIYGGCGGNANNFQTEAQCRDECVPTVVNDVIEEVPEVEDPEEAVMAQEQQTQQDQESVQESNDEPEQEPSTNNSIQLANAENSIQIASTDDSNDDYFYEWITNSTPRAMDVDSDRDPKCFLPSTSEPLNSIYASDMKGTSIYYFDVGRNRCKSKSTPDPTDDGLVDIANENIFLKMGDCREVCQPAVRAQNVANRSGEK